MLYFYDINGDAVVYSQDGIHIYTIKGAPVAYFSDDSIYSFSGQHLGRIRNGWIRDNNGDCVLFVPEASGGPIKPLRNIRPIRGIKSIRPIKNIRQIRPITPISSLEWSRISAQDFFEGMHA